ncbi:CBS domain-containing protein [Streptomyces sp. SID14478]|uniref:CBS domain-containing protein n=1 Tax=Streptomyces sp. SID14478 TaxID=2706073 RepID=UPI0013D97190|nr:CBS domain-containing protein [Streptomyces sp. SID14478]NEB76365.1 CBS domain-containing protein [Streptomyces sp. SID14478]
MRHRTVQDLMTHTVITVRAETSFKEVAVKLADHGIDAVPVVDARDCPVGVVSETDLLRREASRPDPQGHLTGSSAPAGGQGESAGELMTSPAVCAQPQWNVVEAARAMDGHQVKRLPVVDETGKIVGIISRGDLLRVFLRRDAAIREEIVYDVLDRTLGIGQQALHVAVSEGVATLRGSIEPPALHSAVLRLCQSVDGVVAVHELPLDAPAVRPGSRR